MTAPVPDLKRNIEPPVPGSECCECCEGIHAETPQAISNPPGLARIAYRVGGHAQFRASLHAALSSSRFALAPATVSPLARLQTRDDGDFTIGLIDAFACAADLLSFYQERIASESYLRTAVERVSVQEMGKLVGYRLAPGIAAETLLAFALETPPLPPPNLPPEPGNFVTGVPASLRLGAGLKVQSVAGPDEKPQTFELVEALEEARPEWNAIRPWLSERHDPVEGDSEAWFAGVETLLQPGDGLLFVGQDFLAGANDGQWQFRTISIVEPRHDEEVTRVAWAIPLTNVLAAPSPTFVYAMRGRTGLFGANAPIWASMSGGFRTDYEDKFGPPSSDDWPLANTIANNAAAIVDLDSLQPAIFADVTDTAATRSFAILVDADSGVVSAHRISAASEVSRAEFAISAKVTRLGLSGAPIGSASFGFVRATSVYARSELMTVAPRPVIDAVGGDHLPVDIGAAGLGKGRRVIVVGTPVGGTAPVAAPAVVVAEANNAAADRTDLRIDPPLATPLRRESVVVHANVALASHGESVSQILGSGEAAQRFQRFELTHLPLTCRAAATETGAVAELIVRVGDVAWQERPTLYGATPADHAYVLEVDEQGRNFVAFGDGLRGARLPSGSNVLARYRKGSGAEGNVAADTLTQLMTRPLGLKSVSNPLAAEGGTDPEAIDAARISIPIGTLTLGRVVSVLDYQNFALGFTGIAKAQAQVLNLGAEPTVVVTLAGDSGAGPTPASPVWTSLTAALKASGDPHVPVILLPYQASTFHIGIRVKYAGDREKATVFAAVDAALRAYFSFEARALGQPVHQSEVIAVAQAVPGVVAVDLTSLYGGTVPGQTAVSLRTRLLAARMHVAGGAARPAELLTLDPGPLALLEEMP
jgi:predicted phage baseplate assembly protein